MLKKTTKKIATAVFAIMIMFTIATPALAETDLSKIWDGTAIVPDCDKDTSSESEEVSADGNTVTVTSTVTSNECDWEDLIVLANNVVTFLVWLAATLVVIAFCYAGFLYITAFGEMGKIEQAHGIFKSAIIGLFFVICGWLIIATILQIIVGSKDNAEIKKIIDYSNVTTITGQAH